MERLRDKTGVFICSAVAVLALAIPAGVQFHINRFVRLQVQTITTGSATEARASGQRLRHLRYIADVDPLVVEYQKTSDTNRQHLVAEVYRDITGDDIGKRLMELND